MRYVKVFLLIICCAFQLSAQETEKHKKEYKVWVKLINGKSIKGYLLQLKDSSITVAHGDSAYADDFLISDIEKLKFRRKGRVGRGIAIGAGSGLVLGAVSGYAAGDDYWFGSKEEGAAFAGTLLMPLGATVGGLIGAIKKTYLISGNLNNYAELKSELLKFERQH